MLPRARSVSVIFCVMAAVGVGVMVLLPASNAEPARATAPEPSGDARPLADRPLYQMSEDETADFLVRLHARHDGIADRALAAALANLGQPYELYLLGEAPFETIDDQPVYWLPASDCVTFVEHNLAMALADDFDGFVTMLQRIRYADGRVGVRTRNHYTEADWNRNNAWLLDDVSANVSGDAAATYGQKVDRAKFFRDRYKLDVDVKPERIVETYVPLEAVMDNADKLRAGDVVNFVRGRGDGLWVGHVGLVDVDDAGRVWLVHSAEPRVLREPLADVVESALARASDAGANRVRLAGFKFLRPRPDALSRLRAIDGPSAPAVIAPDRSPFDPAAARRHVREATGSGAR